MLGLVSEDTLGLEKSYRAAFAIAKKRKRIRLGIDL